MLAGWLAVHQPNPSFETENPGVPGFPLKSNVSPRKTAVAGARCFEQRELLCRVSPRVASVFAEVFKSHTRPAFLLHLHAQTTSSRLATSPSRVAQALHPSGSRTSATATQGCKVRWWLALRAAVLRRAVRTRSVVPLGRIADNGAHRTLRPARSQRKVATNARSPRSVSLTERPRSTPVEAEG